MQIVDVVDVFSGCQPTHPGAARSDFSRTEL